MADSWEDEADDLASAGPAAVLPTLAKLTDKWDDEDLDEVPDSWDAEPQQATTGAAATDEASAKKSEPGAADKAKSKKRSKQLAAAAEKKKQEAEEKRRQLAEEAATKSGDAVPGAADANLSKEELRRLQEKADLLVAMDTFSVNEPADPQKSIDLLQPSSKEDFERLQRLLSQKLRQYEASPHYPLFVEALFRDCTLELDCDSLRKLSTMFSALAAEKQKLQHKAVKGKKKTKGVVKVERDAASGALEEDFGYDEYDDFI